MDILLKDHEWGPQDHAMLFAALAQTTLRRFGEQARGPLGKAVHQYGLERGSRMAQRAQMDGRSLDLSAYIAYGEWQTKQGAIHFYFTEYTPKVLWKTERCPWAQAWEEHNTPMEIRRIYCDHVDEALGQGFAGHRMLIVHEHQHKGDAYCLFEYPDALMSDALYEKAVHDKADMRDRVVMDWGFHMAHLYYSMLTTLQEELGQPLSDLFQEALAHMSNHSEIEAVLAQYRDHDFKKA